MNAFWTAIQENFGYTNLEIRRIQYTLKYFGTDLSKILILLVLFAAAGKGPEYLVGICVLCTLRSYSGGAHMKHYWSCFFCSFFVMFLSVCLLPLLPLPHQAALWIVGVCCILTYGIGPIPSKQRPVFSYEAWKKFRLRSTCIVFFYFLLAVFFPNFRYLDIVVWTIFVQTLQLIITSILQKGEQRYEKVTEQKMDKESV